MGPAAYRIEKNLRDLLVFSEQDLIADPPFSRLDLISCRNLLIYFNAELQKKLIPLFHYALKPNGYLFLGTSESVGDATDLFTLVDRQAKLYQRRADSFSFGGKHGVLGQLALRLATRDPSSAVPHDGATTERVLSWRELTERTLLQEITQSAVLVNSAGDALYFHGRTGQFLEPTPGESTTPNILRMAREGLRHELTHALHKTTLTNTRQRTTSLRVKTNGEWISATASVCPVTSPAIQKAPLFLVILEPALIPAEPNITDAVLAATVNEDLRNGSDVQIAALRNALRAKEEYLQSTTEELETANEELKSSNEEMQSINEELQSTNEELETSKEELQSVNEELTTVNTELENKLAELSRANNDMNNLLAGTGIATVFVDHHLCLLRFTPTAINIINLIFADIGRPIGHVVTNFCEYNDLVADTQAVLDTLVPVVRDVRTNAGKGYTMRIQPYRTLENVIEGAVLTFVEIQRTIHSNPPDESAPQR